MLFWIFFILIEFILLGEFSFRHKKITKKLGIALFVIVSILRFDVGFDYATYYSILYPQLDTLEYERLEPLSKLFFYIAYVCNCPPIVFALFAFVTYGFIILSIKQNSCNFSISIIVYLSLFYLQSLGLVRQSASVSIVFWGVKYIFKRDFVRYLLVCVLAFLFHKSALVSIVIYPIYNYFSMRFVLALWGVIYFSTTAIEKFWLDSNLLYSGYIGRYELFLGGSKVRYVYPLLMALVLFIAKCFSIRYDNKMVKVLLFGTIFPFLFGAHLGGRLSEYFYIFLCLFISDVIFFLKVKYRVCVLLFVICIFISHIYISDMSNIGRKPFTPYQIILFQDLDNPKLNIVRL